MHVKFYQAFYEFPGMCGHFAEVFDCLSPLVRPSTVCHICNLSITSFIPDVVWLAYSLGNSVQLVLCCQLLNHICTTGQNRVSTQWPRLCRSIGLLFSLSDLFYCPGRLLCPLFEKELFNDMCGTCNREGWLFNWNHCCNLGISCSGSKQILILGRASGPGREKVGLTTSESWLGSELGNLWMENCQLGRDLDNNTKTRSPRDNKASERCRYLASIGESKEDNTDQYFVGQRIQEAANARGLTWKPE